MTYKEFVKKYNGKYVDFDGAYGYQCWDLAQFYFTEVLGVPSSVLSGCGWVSKMLVQPKRAELDEYFNEVSTIGMQQGDVCIWSDPSDIKNCHIAIFDHYNEKDNNCYYFSQNPNPCQVMAVNMIGHHAFRLKTKQEVAPNVPRDESKTQIKVLVDNLNVRIEASLSAASIGYANVGYYDIYEIYNYDGYTWYRIAEHQWVAYSPEWEEICPAKEDEYVKFKVLNEKDGCVEIDLGKVWVKKETQL